MRLITTFFYPKAKKGFCLLFWLESKLFINDCPLTLVSFFEWLGTCWDSFSIFSCLSLGGEGRFVSCIPWVTLLVALRNSIRFFTYQKKEKKKKEKKYTLTHFDVSKFLGPWYDSWFQYLIHYLWGCIGTSKTPEFYSLLIDKKKKRKRKNVHLIHTHMYSHSAQRCTHTRVEMI